MNIPADGIQCTVNSQVLMVYRCGDVYRLLKNGDWRLVANTANNGVGYNQVSCGYKLFYRHRIIAYAYLGLDIDDLTKQIDHINGIRQCNNVDNLRIVSAQENQHNHTKAKGYTWCKAYNKWKAKISLNNKTINLGYYNTPEEAREAYLAAKLIHHPSAPIRDA
jgi:hypothetical protein